MVSYRVYECESSKKADVNKILEADPYVEGSFARTGYKAKDGTVLGEDKAKLYVYMKASDEFLAAADKKLEGILKRCPKEVEDRIYKKIQEEEEAAESGLGDIFG